MDEKDFETSVGDIDEKPENEEVASLEENQVEYDTEISGIGVNYENNDDWKFDAEAPMINDDLLKPDDETISFQEIKASAEDEKDKSKEDIDYEKKNQLVIDRSVLSFLPVALVVAISIVLVSYFSCVYFTVPNGKEGKYANPGSIVAVVDDVKISAGAYNYYYSTVRAYYEQYEESGLDTSIALDSQYTTDRDGNQVTWAEFLESETINQIKQIAGVYNIAIEKGIKLTSAQKQMIDDQIASKENQAASENMTLQEYLEYSFGPYCSEETVRTVLEQYFTAINFNGYIYSQEPPSDEKINEYYEEHKDEFDKVKFSFIALEYDTASEKTKAESLKKAEEYLDKIKDRKSIEKLVPEVYADYITQDAAQIIESGNDMTEEEAIEYATENYVNSIDYVTTINETPLDQETTSWLFDSSTKVGDKKLYINEDAGFIYIIYKAEEVSADSTETYSVRHILVMPKDADGNTLTTTDAEITDEQWEEAKKTADDILEKYNKSDKTEYDFALLAEEYSDDTASTSSSGVETAFGGLCDATSIGTMVSEFEDWSVDTNRKYGDTGIIKSSYGYHIMFFVNHCDSYKANAISGIKAQNLSDIIENASVKINQGRIDYVMENYESMKKTTQSSQNATNIEQY